MGEPTETTYWPCWYLLNGTFKSIHASPFVVIIYKGVRAKPDEKLGFGSLSTALLQLPMAIGALMEGSLASAARTSPWRSTSGISL